MKRVSLIAVEKDSGLQIQVLFTNVPGRPSNTFYILQTYYQEDLRIQIQIYKNTPGNVQIRFFHQIFPANKRGGEGNLQISRCDQRLWKCLQQLPCSRQFFSQPCSTKKTSFTFPVFKWLKKLSFVGNIDVSRFTPCCIIVFLSPAFEKFRVDWYYTRPFLTDHNLVNLVNLVILMKLLNLVNLVNLVIWWI